MLPQRALPLPHRERDSSPRPCSRPITLADLRLGNRMVLSPMTRSRAVDGQRPEPLAATYYAQRASAGLHDHRGHAGHARRASATSARPASIRRAGRRLEQGDRRGARARAARSSRSSGMSGGSRIPISSGGALPVAPSACRSKAKHSRRRRPKPIPTPRALDDRRDPRHRRRNSARRRERQGSRLRRRRAAWRQRLPARPVPARRRQPAHRPYGGAIRNRARLPLEVAEPP